MKETKNSTLTWIVFIVVFIVAFSLTYELFTGKGIETLFESKSDKCKLEASNNAVEMRDKRLEALKLKETPTPDELEEIERLEISKEVELIDREDYQYFYEKCMK